MKLILGESQYNRIFNNKKRKLVISEGQYKRLIVEANMANGLLGVEKSDIIRLKSGDNSLHFKVVFKTGNELIMINCNDGVYKNAYFHLKGNSLTSNTLSYSIAQNKDIDDKNPWETIGSDVWRESTFKNLNDFKVFKDGGEGLSCNLSKDAEEKFAINMETGEVVKPEEEEGKEEKVDISDEGKLKKDFKKNLNRVSEGYTYVLKLANDEGVGGSVTIKPLNRNAKVIDFEIIDVSGEGGKHYRDLMEKEIKLSIDDTNIDVSSFKVIVDANGDETKNQSQEKMKKTDELIEKPMYSLKIEVFTDETDDEKNRLTEDDVIANIESIGIGEKNNEEKDKEIDETEITDEDINDFVKKYVSDSDILKKALYSQPKGFVNKFLEVLGLAKKRGIIPAEGRMQEWFRSAVKDGENELFYKNFKPNNIFKSELVKVNIDNTNELDGDTSDKVLKLNDFINEKFEVVSKRGSSNPFLLTNFTNGIRLDINFGFKIYISEKLEERDDFSIHSFSISYKKNNSKWTNVGEGKIKIFIKKSK